MDNGTINKVVWEGEVPKDLCGNRGCFAYIDGQCDCLTDTDFKDGRCPFFKARKGYGKSHAAEPKKKMDEPEPEDDFLSANADAMEEIARLKAEADRIEKFGVSNGEGGDDDGSDGFDDSEDG